MTGTIYINILLGFVKKSWALTLDLLKLFLLLGILACLMHYFQDYNYLFRIGAIAIYFILHTYYITIPVIYYWYPIVIITIKKESSLILITLWAIITLIIIVIYPFIEYYTNDVCWIMTFMYSTEPNIYLDGIIQMNSAGGSNSGGGNNFFGGNNFGGGSGPGGDPGNPNSFHLPEQPNRTGPNNNNPQVNFPPSEFRPAIGDLPTPTNQAIDSLFDKLDSQRNTSANNTSNRRWGSMFTRHRWGYNGTLHESHAETLNWLASRCPQFNLVVDNDNTNLQTDRWSRKSVYAATSTGTMYPGMLPGQDLQPTNDVIEKLRAAAQEQILLNNRMEIPPLANAAAPLDAPVLRPGPPSRNISIFDLLNK